MLYAFIFILLSSKKISDFLKWILWLLIFNCVHDSCHGKRPCFVTRLQWEYFLPYGLNVYYMVCLSSKYWFYIHLYFIEILFPFNRECIWHFLKKLSWPCLEACRILVPWPGIELAPSAVEAPSLHQWTAREVSVLSFYEKMSTIKMNTLSRLVSMWC